MSAKKNRRDTMILLLASAFAKCWGELERLPGGWPFFNNLNITIVTFGIIIIIILIIIVYYLIFFEFYLLGEFVYDFAGF